MNVIRNQASSKFRNDRQMSPHTTARPSDAREVTTGVWLMSRDQFDAVHADSHFHSYVTPVHCRISLLLHHAIANTSAGMCFWLLSPETWRKGANDIVGRRNVGPLLAPRRSFVPFVTQHDQLVLQHWVYMKIHALSHKIWCNESTTNKHSWCSVYFFICRSRKVQRQKATRGGDLTGAETYTYLLVTSTSQFVVQSDIIRYF